VERIHWIPRRSAASGFGEEHEGPVPSTSESERSGGEAAAH
jgi:hypothetical protein